MFETSRRPQLNSSVRRLEIRRRHVQVGLAFVAVLAFAVAILPQSVRAQEMVVPVQTQWSLFDRILAFDRTFADRAEDELVVAIMYQARNRVSATAREEFLAAARGTPGRILDQELVRFVSFEPGSSESMRRRLEAEGVDVLYLTPMRAQNAARIAAAASELRVVTLSGVPEYVDDGVGIGLGSRGGRPEILVNLEVCRSVGMDLNSELLKLATLVSNDL